MRLVVRCDRSVALHSQPAKQIHCPAVSMKRAEPLSWFEAKGMIIHFVLTTCHRRSYCPLAVHKVYLTHVYANVFIEPIQPPSAICMMPTEDRERDRRESSRLTVIRIERGVDLVRVRGNITPVSRDEIHGLIAVCTDHGDGGSTGL